MWLVINPDDTVYQVENVKPPDGAYPNHVVKYWNGTAPQKEQHDPQTGELVPGETDPTLALGVDELRRLAYAKAGLTADLLLDLWFDFVEKDIQHLFGKETKDKVQAIEDERKKIKIKYPKATNGPITSR